MIPGIAALALVVSQVLPAPVQAQGDTTVPVVALRFEPRGDRLSVQVHVPVTALRAARLTLFPDGTLDAAGVGEQLQIVAGDIAHNLDVWQGSIPLAAPATGARVGPDRTSIDVELVYQIAGGIGGLSARLNTLTGSSSQPIRSVATFLPPAGPAQEIELQGEARRVQLDPTVLGTIGLFTREALRVLLAGGDHWLFLPCVLLLCSRAREAAVLLTSMIVAQGVGLAALLLAPETSATAAGILGMIAASAVVVGGLRIITDGERLGRTQLLTLAFGIANGFGLGASIAVSRQLGGSHPWVAVLTFAVVLACGEAWLGGLGWIARVWLHDKRVPDRLVAWAPAIVVIHAALHRVDDRGRALAAAATVGEHPVVWLTLAWAAAVLLFNAADALRDRGVDGGHLGSTTVASG